MCPIFAGSVHNFGKSDNDKIWVKMLISTRCLHGFVSNLIKKSWTDSSLYVYLCDIDISLYSQMTMSQRHINVLKIMLPTKHFLRSL